MKIVDKYKCANEAKEKINREKCNTPGSIYKVDLSCSRVSVYGEHPQSDDFAFGNVFEFKGEATKALIDVINLYESLNNYYGKVNYYDMIKKSAFVILNDGSISEITREYIAEENKKNTVIGIGEWTFENYIKTWYNINNCFVSLHRASVARDKIADIFERITIADNKNLGNT